MDQPNKMDPERKYMNFAQVNWAGWVLLSYCLFSILVTPILMLKNKNITYVTFLTSIALTVIALIALGVF